MLLPAFERVEGGQGALRPCVAHPAPRDQPGCARASQKPTAIASSGSTRLSSLRRPTRWTGVWPALPAGAAPGLWQREDPGLRHDQDLGQHHARLLWWLLLLLHHRSTRAHHPEPLEESILKEIEEIRDKVPGFTGVIRDLGGPTANMYKFRCKSLKAEQTCRRASCV